MLNGAGENLEDPIGHGKTSLQKYQSFLNSKMHTK